MKRKGVILGVSFVFFLVVSSVAAARDMNTISAPASSIPVLKQIAGKGIATLEPGRYPEFVSVDTFPQCKIAAACARELKAKSVKLYKANELANFVPIPGWQSIEVAIPEKNRIGSKILILWTVRVEFAANQEALRIDRTCRGWCGTSLQKFKGGNVYAQLFVDGNPKGNMGALTVHDFGNITYHVPPPPPPRDEGNPAINGSVLLTKADFGGMLPAKIKLQLRWFNDTACRMESRNDQRQIIIKIIPGQQRS